MLRPAQRVEFYPGNLGEQIAAFLNGWQIPETLPAVPVGGIVPHAGWRYSGRVAARVLHALAVRAHPRCLVMLGAVHRRGVPAPGLYDHGGWETPAGTVEVDGELAGRIADASPNVVFRDPHAHDQEHSLEVLMPMIRLLMPGCMVVPIAVPAAESALALGESLGSLLDDSPSVLTIASTDLTHYGVAYDFVPAGEGAGAERWMRGNDARMIQRITALECEEVLPEASLHHNACGAGAITAALTAARRRGRRRAHVIEYTTSFHVTGEKNFRSAVGYLGAVL